jgi:hypothetical protein
VLDKPIEAEQYIHRVVERLHFCLSGTIESQASHVALSVERCAGSVSATI